jgi:hypothetical protein
MTEATTQTAGVALADILTSLAFLAAVAPFAPPEISQLRSLKQGRRILERNGFHPLDLAFGLRSLFAFKVLVGSRVRD